MKAIEILRPYVRNSDFPIDAFSVFTSYDDAIDYAHNNPSAYATQIIGIDDKKNRQTAIYKLAYDPNQIYRLILERIEIGNGTNLFNFKGSVDTVELLPTEDVRQGDMWLVGESNEMYVAFLDSFKNISWKKMSVSVQYASRTTDGILKKEVYKTFYNETGNDALYFSKKVNTEENPNLIQPIPEKNSWIEVEHTKRENANKYAIPSVGMVKKIIGTISDSSTPHVEMVAVNPETDEVLPTDSVKGSFIFPKLNITYIKEFGGVPLHYTITRSIDNNTPEIVKEAAITSYDETLIVDGRFYWSIVDDRAINIPIKNSVKYTISVRYDESEDSDLPPGFCSASIDLYFYNTIVYGHNLKTFPEVFFKNDMTISLVYDPDDYDNYSIPNVIHKIFIKIPENAKMDYIEYTPQNDRFAKNLFTIDTDSFGAQTFTYNLKSGTVINNYFKNPGEFKFHIIPKS